MLRQLLSQHRTHWHDCDAQSVHKEDEAKHRGEQAASELARVFYRPSEVDGERDDEAERYGHDREHLLLKLAEVVEDQRASAEAPVQAIAHETVETFGPPQCQLLDVPHPEPDREPLKTLSVSTSALLPYRASSVRPCSRYTRSAWP